MKRYNFNKTRLIILDIDNTLTNNSREITKYTQEIIKETVNKGIYVVLCSGRTNQYTIEKSKLCNASPIVISDNGAIIYDYNLQKTHTSYNFSKNNLNKIFKLCNENNVDCVFNTINSRYRSDIHKSNEYIKNINLIQNIDDIQEDVTQIVIDSKNKSDLKKCFDIILTFDDVEITNTNLHAQKEKNYYFCDINIKGISKGLSIKKLMNMLNIKEDETICFGDSMNDYTMLEASEYFIAMKNAEEKLKEKAYMITEYDNNEDGVAKFINQYIINNNEIIKDINFTIQNRTTVQNAIKRRSNK